MTTDLSTLTPTAIDTELARIWDAEQICRLATHRERQFIANPPRWVTEKQLAGHVEHLATMEAGIARARAEAAPYEAEYARRPWNRYFLVTNTGGHVHRGMNCATCFPTTEYAWIIDLADCDEATMVEEYGEKACTICFPDAPAHPSFAGPGRRNRAARDERAAVKAERDAVKAAKAITAPDGQPLRVDGWVIGTKVAAQRKLTDVVQSYGWYGPTHPMNFAGQAETLIEALEHVGIDTAPIISRAAAKVRKEGADFTFTRAAAPVA